MGSTTVYMNASYADPVAAQDNFHDSYNFADPLEAMHSYSRYVLGLAPRPSQLRPNPQWPPPPSLSTLDARLTWSESHSVMHQHTKRQMDSATRSARRRSPNGVNATGTLHSESTQDSRTSVGSDASGSTHNSAP